MKGSIIILGFFILGVILGLTDHIPEILKTEDFSIYALYLLMFLVGIGIGADRESWRVIRSMNVKLFFVPLGVITGTYIGALIIGLFIPSLTTKEVLAVGSGFGYYSLSSIFITEMHSESLGVIALLSNIIREIMTLLLAPVFVKYFGKLAGIAAGGATAMDTTLPIITQYSGKEFAIISVFSGIVLTIATPFLIALILA